MKTIVTLKKSCAANLHEMPHVAEGVFCTHCNLNVRDLTTMNEETFAGWIKETEGKAACGIYRKDQVKVPVMQKFLFPFRYAAISIIAFFAAKNINAQHAPTTVPATSPDASKNMLLQGDTVIYSVKGHAVYEKNDSVSRSLAFIHVRAECNGKTVADTLTNQDGNFELRIPAIPGQIFTIKAGSFEYSEIVIENYVPNGTPLVLTFNQANNQVFYGQKIMTSEK
jgi:hypothetical protein